MASVIMLGLVLGVVLIRFNVFALIPAMCLGSILVAAGGGVLGDGPWHVLATVAVFWVAVQLGYLIPIISLSLWVGGSGQTGSQKLFSERHEHDFATGLADRLAPAIAPVDGEEKAPVANVEAPAEESEAAIEKYNMADRERQKRLVVQRRK
jgi:hypothetical protein